jgi:hypothetical protein
VKEVVESPQKKKEKKKRWWRNASLLGVFTYALVHKANQTYVLTFGMF